MTVLSSLLVLSFVQPAERLRPDGELRPGLAAAYRPWPSGPDDLPLLRIDAKPAGTWGDSSPHPRLRPGPFEAVWTGIFHSLEDGTLRFGAYAGGSVRVSVGGIDVLDGRGDPAFPWIQGREARAWAPGFYRIRVAFRSEPGVPARLQLWWEGAGFSREPLPPWRLKHAAADLPPDARREEDVARGRAAAERAGCARCHAGAFPSAATPPPGPSLHGLGRRVDRAWLLDWLDDPSRHRPAARMPALFPPGRRGFVERWIVAERLLGPDAPAGGAQEIGDPRKGRVQFLSLGCAACHRAPDLERDDAVLSGRPSFHDLRSRMTPESLVAFLQDPKIRYPDGRMPALPVDAPAARDLAAYLLDSSPDPAPRREEGDPPTAAERAEVVRSLGAADVPSAADGLLVRSGCQACHPGPGAAPLDRPVRDLAGGCLSGRTLPRFGMDDETRRALGAFLAVAAKETHPSPFDDRRRLLAARGCASCHSVDADGAAPLEAVGAALGTEVRQHRLPFQRTPRLTNAHLKYERSYLRSAVRDGVRGVRPGWYSYKMPSFGAEADALVRALAEADGDPAEDEAIPSRPVADPVAFVEGPVLVGFEGYSCITCHLWKGENLTSPDPAAVGPELTSVAGRIRRDWFDRWLEEPSRAHPGTPMPSVLRKGRPAAIRSAVYGDDPGKQKEAIWSYLSRGKDADSPKSPPPIAVDPPPPDAPLAALIPLQERGRPAVERLVVLTHRHDLLLYDPASARLERLQAGARILRKPRPRGFLLSDAAPGIDVDPAAPFRLSTAAGPEAPDAVRFLGYERLTDGVRVRLSVRLPSAVVELTETLRFVDRVLERHVQASGVPEGAVVELQTRLPEAAVVPLRPDATLRYRLPSEKSPPRIEPAAAAGAGRIADTAEGSLERPGYRAIAYPRPTTAAGDDAIMPYAFAVEPCDGRLFIASEKRGEILVLRDPNDDGRDARFEDFAGGLYHQAYGLFHDGEGLTVLHRNNLTRMRDTDGDGRADAFERIAGGSEWPSDSRAFGLLRDREGAYWFNVADNKKAWPGSAAALRLSPGSPSAFEDAAFGIRQAYGWCFGARGDIWFTDNQGEWVATNKLCLLEPGRFYGFRNPEKPGDAGRPEGKAAVLIPYGWAKSINGVAFDDSRGKFGPFAGQFFLAEMMYGGGLIRAQVETVNGRTQGACFPFWGKGLLGPLVVAFDPKGRLFVGGMTEAECGAQPDRGAIFRIDFTGPTPFEIRSIHARPRGFRLVFTRPADPTSNPSAFALEHFRYEYSGAYGSPELDRTAVGVRRVRWSDGGLSVDLETDPLVKDRVYLVQAKGVRSAAREPLVHPIGAYTLNEIPRE